MQAVLPTLLSRMPFHRPLLSWSYFPLRLAKSIGRPLRLCATQRLRVLLYHDVAPHEQARFAEQLRWLGRMWTFITPQHFAAMVTGEEPIRGANLLLTFDDGFASNRVVAEQVLNPMGIRALFFAVADLVALDDREAARCFIAQRIYPGVPADALPAHWYGMGWADLEALLEQGHMIGSHTMTHARLSKIISQTEREQEIIGGADVLARRLGIAIDHFAYPFGDLASFSHSAFEIARRRFQCVFTGLRGDNAGVVSPFALRRDSAAAQDGKQLIGAFLEGAADLRYARMRALIDAWSMVSHETVR